MAGRNSTILPTNCFLMMYHTPESYIYLQNIYRYILSICVLSIGCMWYLRFLSQQHLSSSALCYGHSIICFPHVYKDCFG